MSVINENQSNQNSALVEGRDELLNPTPLNIMKVQESDTVVLLKKNGNARQYYD